MEQQLILKKLGSWHLKEKVKVVTVKSERGGSLNPDAVKGVFDLW